MKHITSVIQSGNNNIRDLGRFRKVMTDLSQIRRKRNPLKKEERGSIILKKSKASYSNTRTRPILKLNEYKGPIARSKRKKLFILKSEKPILGISSDMEKRNEQPRDKNHEERQGVGRDAARNQGNPRFENRRRVRDSPLNIIGDQHDLPVLPKGTLTEFFGDGEIDEKRHLHLFLNVFDFHRVEYDDVIVRLFLQTLSGRAYEWSTTLPNR
jgi:hypothetical protein